MQEPRRPLSTTVEHHSQAQNPKMFILVGASWTIGAHGHCPPCSACHILGLDITFMLSKWIYCPRLHHPLTSVRDCHYQMLSSHQSDRYCVKRCTQYLEGHPYFSSFGGWPPLTSGKVGFGRHGNHLVIPVCAPLFRGNGEKWVWFVCSCKWWKSGWPLLTCHQILSWNSDVSCFIYLNPLVPQGRKVQQEESKVIPIIWLHLLCNLTFDRQCKEISWQAFICCLLLLCVVCKERKY